MAAMPGPVWTAFRAIHGNLPAAAELKILNAHQDATVTAIAELILPQTETPGAKAARVNEFIDRIVAEWYEEEERAAFLAGLAEVDTRTQGLFAHNFVDVSAEQQADI